MLRSSFALALACLLLAAGCSTGPATSPAPSTPATSGQPSGSPQPSSAPSLDPALSDAGVVALATLPNDTRGDRTGTHVIIGQASAGSDCGPSLEGDEFTAVAWVDDAADGQLARLSVTVPAADVPAADGTTADIDGRVSFDFVSESGFGTLYTGDASQEDEGRSTIGVVRIGDLLAFSFEGVTWDDVAFSGQALCLTD